MAVAIHGWRPSAGKYVELPACSLLAKPLLQGAEFDVVPDLPDLPFGLLLLADGINPVVE
jgi:hypothetical protein